ncbi:UDP-glucuronosyl/UDP-glucosyltransferase [Corchorus olitorius]|uniref:7-deoxyloganetic acid glucosyltransferase n=1 Tax=Corchorus olitorius TaxID=93759 RepID=A0A1R3JRD1_9ROSI|nr:UDP-glucuronosyl/UDP-glucosyltransferase [Corchorus olitorius]
MEQKQAQAATPHVVFLASPFQGHIKPMLKLAELLSHASFQVTFINTEHVHERFIPSIDIQEFHRRFPNFQFLSIPDGLPLDNPRSLKHGLELLFSLRAVVKPELCQLLISLQSPTCIIADGLIISSAIDAGEEFGIPVFAFRTYSACSVWVYFHLSNLVEAGEVPFQEEDMDMLVTCIPGLENVLRRRDLPSLCRALKKDRITDNPLLEYFTSQALAMRRASALLLNTFDELERPMIEISFVTIQSNYDRFLVSTNIEEFQQSHPNIHFLTFADSLPPQLSHTIQGRLDSISSFKAKTKPALHEDLDKPITQIPDLGNVIRFRDLPSCCRIAKIDKRAIEFSIDEFNAASQASALIINTFDEFEAPMISKLSSYYSKIFSIGPLHCLLDTQIDNSFVWKSDSDCLTWLDTQPSRSVVYVSFGSVTFLKAHKLLEIWHGLVNSGKSFLLVIRPNSIIEEDGLNSPNQGAKLKLKFDQNGATRSSSNTHVVFLPFPLQGHMKPMLKLAELLSHASNFHVSFINTEYVHQHLLPSIDIQAFYRRFPNFHFLSISDGLPVYHPRSGKHAFELLSSLRAVTKPELCKLLVSLSRETEEMRRQPPTCIIADGIMSCSAIEAAEEFGIPVFTFRTYSACCTWTCFNLLNLIEEGEVPFQGKDMDKLVTCIPGLENVVRRRDLHSVCRVKRADDPPLEFIISQTSAMRLASALILNTFDELERPILSQLSSIFPKIYTIGPLHGLSNNICINDDPSFALASRKSIMWKEDRHCITWLDSQPLESVLFVSFGSVVSLTHDQMLEFWHGLVNSEKPFLWVIRPNSITTENDERDDILMDLENRAKGKGLIVSWTPQEEILAHPAIGGFLTHSGWNSTLESIYEGVPMICWPLIADQQVNSRCVSDVWRIGFDMKDSCERSIIEKMVRDLMESTKREEVMKTMDKFAKLAKESVKEGGSSYCNFEKLIKDVRSLV